MKKIIRKIKRIIKLIGVLFYLLFYRIKFIGHKKGIAQVVDSFNSGGLEQVAVNIYRAFKDNGNISSIICVSNNVGPMAQQLDSPKELRIIYYDIIEMIKYCAKNNIRTLVFHFSTFHMIFLKMIGFKNYYIIHNTYIWYTEKEWKNLKIKLKFTNGIIAVSEWCKDYFIRKTGIKNIKVILNGINFENLKNGEICSINRNKLKIKKDELICLTIGSYTNGKHQMGIIGIAEEIIKVNKKIKFICAGPILDKKYYNNLLKSVNKSKAKNNIILLDYIPQEEVGSFIENNCDIYLQPSIHEAGVPLTVMEALLKGKPVIMTDFMVNKTFIKTDRIFGIKPPYEDILKITPEIAEKISKKTYDTSTNDFVTKIIEVSNKLDSYKNFDSSKFDFLDSKRMAKDYIKYIKL